MKATTATIPPRRSARLAKVAEKPKPVPTTEEEAPAKAVTKKRKAASSKQKQTSRKAEPPKKTRKTGLKQAITDTSAPLGVIDPEAKIKGSIITRDEEPCDAMLVLVDPSKSMDKFFILQLILNHDKRKTKKKFAVYTRWGRTGTKGQAQLVEYADEDEATSSFMSKFKSKTGLAWEDRDEPTKGKNYRFIRQDFEQKLNGYTGAKWQYWVDDGVDNKQDGWYDYDASASKLVEQLFHEFANNQNISGRSIDSGMYAYDVDLHNLVQTNVRHPNRTQRRIRRFPVGSNLDDSPPVAIVASSTNINLSVNTNTASATANASNGATIVTPTNATPTNATPTNATPTNATTTTTTSSSSNAKSNSGGHPVDPDISVAGKQASSFTVLEEDGLWYDAVLNQCNIGGNNNKYYRLQCLEHNSTGEYFAWFRWGRVGEPARSSASTWMGPYFSSTNAIKEFRKKFSAKTKNSFGADEFVPHTGKYTLIEIDNNVKVSDEYKVAPAANKQEVEYMDSQLHAKTQELISTLFSQDMRNEALSSFNLDLKRLPLGVPSQQQINRGVDILANIEKKLSGDRSIRDSYMSLSSDFYTAIPHSFGRSRPPVIQTDEALRSRYDMCNILMDMFDTNETVRRIEREQHEEMAEKTVLPNPIDQHYKSLGADLSFVDPNSMEFSTIKQCFLGTGGQSSNSQLLNVWSVNRGGEADRFKPFDEVDNRCLLWHGTNIAVVAPIITSGLRIMPHSGGRVGSGIYLASMQAKSAQYTSGYGAKYACMFLCEAPLGKQHPVDQDGHHASSLKQAPKGFDSVHAKGQLQPKKWSTMSIDGKTVKVPQGACKQESKNASSSFYHDEFLVYNEEQVRLRYVLTVKL